MQHAWCCRGRQPWQLSWEGKHRRGPSGCSAGTLSSRDSAVGQAWHSWLPGAKDPGAAISCQQCLAPTPAAGQGQERECGVSLDCGASLEMGRVAPRGTSLGLSTRDLMG